MQIFEALISLMFLLSIASYLLLQADGQRIDDSLYRMQLAEDAWRVLYLRGDFEDFSDTKRAVLENDMAEIGRQTGLCIFMDGVVFTSCRDGKTHEITASLAKTAISEGKPLSFTFSIGK